MCIFAFIEETVCMAAIKYPIGVQDFAKLREGGYVYIDKTEYIHKLIANGNYYFLSRPRRFGKSLLLSTIEAFYKGRRELFDGLAISRHDYDWQPRPVFHLSLNKPVIEKRKDLEDKLNSFLREGAEIYGNDETSDNIALRFGGLIKKAYETSGRKVVILVDEYDKPLLDAVDNTVLQDELRSILRGFYSNLKDLDKYIEFAIFTGVTKFGKLSIFSDLNNLNDVSLDKAFDAICGLTEQDIRTYLDAGVASLAAANDIDTDKAYAELKESYDGYHFAPDGCDIYNPFSIINALSKGVAGDYWFNTGTPTFLVKMIKAGQMKLRDLNSLEVPVGEISSVSFSLGDVVPVLYQSGYLTIKSFDREFQTVTLGFPNREVERGFMTQLLAIYTPLEESKAAFSIVQFVRDVREGRIDDFMKRLQSLFAGYQYDQMELGNLELHYRNVIYLVMKLMGYYTRAEMQTSRGRIDLLVATSDYIYIFEFKVDGTAAQAIKQINDRDYAGQFGADGRRVVKIGANFSGSERGITDWIVE